METLLKLKEEFAMADLAAPPATNVQFTVKQLNLSTATPIGSGAVSNVVQSTLSSPLSIPVAVKTVSKIQLLQQHKVSNIMNEKNALLQLAPHPYIGRLYGTAQSEDELYFIMEHLPHGDLLQHIRRTASRRVQDYAASLQLPGVSQSGVTSSTGKQGGGAESSQPLSPLLASVESESKLFIIPPSSASLRCLDFNDIRLITAQLILGLAHVFSKGFVLRDLKPENIVFDNKYRACLIDFDTIDLEGGRTAPESNGGVALPKTSTPINALSSEELSHPRVTVSEIQQMRRRTAMFCGTAQYVSPEMVGQCKWSFCSDLWALGTMVYEMLYGVHMFSGDSSFLVLQKVIRGCSAPGGVNSDTVPFPFVNLDAGQCFSNDGGPGPFERVKDFILSLVRIDPVSRLGVHPTTRAFDLETLKAHSLFSGFDWTMLEAHLKSFRPRVFALCGGTAGSGTAATAPSADPDPSVSLRACYQEIPRNDPHYADYVYRATADVNPFESFMSCIVLSEEARENKNENGRLKDDSRPLSAPSPHTLKEGLADASTTCSTGTVTGCQKAGDSGDGSRISAAVSPTMKNADDKITSIDDDDMDDLEVIDDVGMHYRHLRADSDFHL